ncbi:MAG: S1C family serine protease, partial [Planctomycetota bacterium]
GYAEPSLHFGIVSAVNRIFGKAVQTDAKTSPVNYGGPLVDLEGRMVGIIVPLSRRGTQAGVGMYNSGIGFAIPGWDLPAVVETLKKGEEIHPGFLGIQPDPNATQGGARIANVIPGSAAHRAGLQKGETIVAVDGKKIKTFMDLFGVLGRKKAGDRIQLTVRSAGGEERVLEVVLGKRE